MDMKDKSTIQRMLGTIEGVAFAMDDKVSAPLFDAVEVIESIIDKEEVAEQWLKESVKQYDR